MKHIIKHLIFFYLFLGVVYAQNTKAGVNFSKKEEDKKAIRSLAGIYKVHFDFSETFSPDTAYQYHKKYREWGIEYVILEEESENKLVLQHLLIVNDTIIIKHWRQDWVYEEKNVLAYYKDNEWIKTLVPPHLGSGTWTQKVYQVDDSPRYESTGTWLHVDGKHYWEGTADSPLPRREFTKRSDYNVLKRHSRIELFEQGWFLEQDNEKIMRANGIDQLLCWEKGMETFTKGSYDATPGKKWWESHKIFWADVRQVWAEVYAKQDNTIAITKKVNDKLLFESLFELDGKQCDGKTYVKGSALADIKQIVQAHINRP